MKCPRCDREGQVLDSRVRPDGVRRRRYVCVNQHRFSTLELLAAPTPGEHGTPLTTHLRGERTCTPT